MISRSGFGFDLDGFVYGLMEIWFCLWFMNGMICGFDFDYLFFVSFLGSGFEFAMNR
jgi:hypothetical protein